MSSVDVDASNGVETSIGPHSNKQQVVKLAKELQSIQYTVDLDSDHRIVNILFLCSLRTTKGKLFSRPKFGWSKLQDAATRDQFQIELSNRFKTL